MVPNVSKSAEGDLEVMGTYKAHKSRNSCPIRQQDRL